MSEATHVDIKPLGGNKRQTARQQELEAEVAKLREQNNVLAKACRTVVRFVPRKYAMSVNACRKALQECGLPERV